MSAGAIRHVPARSARLAALSDPLVHGWRTIAARQAFYDAVFAGAVGAAFALPANAGPLFHVAALALAANAFVFGVRSTAWRTGAFVAALATFILASPHLAGQLSLGEWPLMVLIIALVAVLADRRESVARHYASLYRAAARALTGAQEQERRRIARELHDELGQSLAGLTLTLDAANAALAQGRTRDAGRALGEARALGGEAIAGVRRLASDVRPPRFEEDGLVAALTARARRLLPDVELRVLAGGYAEGSLAVDEETELYRCLQEALLNAARHAGARRVRVELASGPRTVRASVTDDGAGFDPARRPAGLGLTGVRERAALLGGTARVTSAPGRGTTVAIELPRRSDP